MDGRRRSFNTALTQTEQREPGLWIAAQTVTVPVRLFGPIEIAAQPFDLAELIVRLGNAADVDMSDVRAYVQGFVFRVAPGALDLHDLRAMYPTDPFEQHCGSHPIAPVGYDLRPGTGPTDIGELVAGAHEVAIDVPGRTWARALLTTPPTSLRRAGRVPCGRVRA